MASSPAEVVAVVAELDVRFVALGDLVDTLGGLGITVPPLSRPSATPHPVVHVGGTADPGDGTGDGTGDGEVLVATMCGCDALGVPQPWTFVATPDALVVAGDGDAGEEIRRTVAGAEAETPVAGLLAAVVGLARSVERAMEQLSNRAHGMDTSTRRFSRADERSELRRLRFRLFVLEEVFGAQAELLGDDEEIARRVGEGDEARRRRARAAFDLDRSISARLYALTGDLMSEETALVNERLTLVSTFFLPLTVSTGFFGMNFGWLTDRIGSLSAFVVLGVVVPLLATSVTLAVVRGMGARAS